MVFRKGMIGFTVITAVVGFMLAIQFQTVKEPVVRDTRDIWELRNDLLTEKERYSILLDQISALDDTIEKYESERETSKEQALRETLDMLKNEAGLTERVGTGITLSVEPVTEEILLGSSIQQVSPDMLQRLVNELNRFGALAISIDGQRLVNTSVIRDINGKTTVNGLPIKNIPFTIEIITKDIDSAQNLFNQLQVSEIVEGFFIDNLRISISSPEENVVVPAYNDTIRIRLMEQVEEGGNS
ncbi:hypothetical protein Q75_05685 [Bacillus coahuilensis p1.1.43]|uniref:NgoFVII family restriction endonuclease n=1 Tax=Bacillus coahuilensis p1.1.43 TaxID=1150625 RepID=A0A147K9A8_9BACI|nr:DUF881 domain-containing protein [Bacillus coahuilensis]KUP07022.1 hypothetical protein Q75_05685 [Bacillus coahuilensis p1.1.43]